MSEATSRTSASRGRGSGRGGRGGFAGRGGRRTNGDKPDHSTADSQSAFEDEGDFGELRKQYGNKTSVIREMFPDWSEADVLFALQETDGDENEAVTRIAEGTISQWGEVSKPKKASRAKAKDQAPTPSNDATSAGPRAARGGRGASEGGRGRGRATERGGRSTRGRPAAAPTNGAGPKENAALSIPTEESSAWGTKDPKVGTSEEKEPVTEQPAPSATEAPKPAAPAVKTWASMLRQSAPPKAAPKPKEAPAAPQPAAEPAELESPPNLSNPSLRLCPSPSPKPPLPPPTKLKRLRPVEPEVALPPSKDELTESNLEQNPASVNATPISAAQQQHQAPPSGFAATAAKATAERTTRVPSHHHQRRVLDQEEAVRMPGNREVDRAAVQFGAFSLNGDEDIDGEREEPETRAQPPADSPVTHPRTSLPPATQAGVPDSFAQKPAPAVAPIAAPTVPAAQSQAQAQIPGQAPASSAQQYGRFGQAAEHPLFSAPFDNFSSQTSQAQQPGAAFSSAPNDYASYYTANQPDRNPYNYYGQQFGQQGGQGQEATASQRQYGGYGASQADNLSQYPQSGLHNQPRFGGSAVDAQNSGNSTPNPTTQAQQQQAQQPAQQQQQPGQGSQPQSHGQQYPGYNHPYYSNPYYHQYYSGYGQGGFGPYGKGGMYGQPYQMSPNAPYDHSSSPAGFGQSSLHRDSGLGASGLGDYGRVATSQAASQPGLGASSFGSVHDSFARGATSFQTQGQSFNSPGQPGNVVADDLKPPFGDSKAGSGPSPSLGGARPGSATNAPAAQSGLPPPQNVGGYGGYPSHLQGHGLHGSNAYGMGGNAGANQHGNSPYGSYNQGFGSGYYGSSQQQQQRGWGNNYQ
ncbi:hypothetical protein NXS19_000712 [Fusarium pseudograminearum]|nr:hypothetical protein NXS19_000712 [Fusarium pseudograminearum]